jgi:hypothetical protein
MMITRSHRTGIQLTTRFISFRSETLLTGSKWGHLDSYFVDATDIEVQVDQGVVTLEGWVDDRPTKKATEDLIDDVPGVRDVFNQLHFPGQPPQGETTKSPTDAAPNTAEGGSSREPGLDHSEWAH